MKKYILKKTTVILIIASMLCALLTAGCAKTESNTNNNADNKEATTQAVTENTTESGTENATENITEAITEAVTSAEPKEVITIKIPSYDKNADLGITVDCTDSNYKYLNVTTLKDIEYDYQLTDEAVKEIFNISVYNFSLSSNIVKLDEKVKVSIPYQEGMYVIYSADGVGYDLNAEYIDGKYVFETDRVGAFIMRTKPVGRTSPTKTTEFTYKEQTLVDEVTGIKVSGNIPVGAEIDTTMYIINCASFSDNWDCNIMENDYPEYTNVMEYYTEYEYEKKVENIGKILKDKNWSSYEGSPGAKIFIEITIIKDYEIIDFNSDMTVTLPFDYHAGLVRGGIKDGPKAVQYDYSNKKFINLDIVSADVTPKGEFQFKINDVGCFFLGGASNVEQIVERYDRI